MPFPNWLKTNNWFNNWLIRYKIILVYVPLIFVPLFILGLSSNRIYLDAVVQKTIKNVSDNSSLIITRISGMLTNVESCANMLTINLNKVIVEDRLTPVSPLEVDLQLYTQITNQLSFALLVFPDVKSAAFIDTSNRVYGSNLAMEVNADLAVNSELLRQIDASTGNNVWFPMQRRSYLTLDPNDPVLTLGKKVVNINTGQKLGIVILNIKESALSTIYQKIGSIQTGSYFISDEQGVMISAQNSQDVLTEIQDPMLKDWVLTKNVTSTIKSFQDGKKLVVSSQVPNFGWKLISMAPFDSLTADTRKITMLISLIGLVCLIFAVLGAGVLSQVIAKPIIELTKHMKRVKEGNLDMELEIRSGDEIGMLASGFNTMIRRIQELLVNINLEQRKKREYELALIQAQIKPHFLYNTLDVIYTLSELGRARDVQRTTKALADFYRVALSKGKETISLEDEVLNVKDYLSIQRIRYSDVFDFENDIDNEILTCTILKLTIQPLVENAIYHGLKTKGSFGHLKISGKREEGKMILKVIDDGVGMSSEREKAVMFGKDENEEPVGYGLRNVHERIKLYFGEEYGLHIDSEPGQGTQVTLQLPFESEES
jgi:two-component system, sensor histidine kinase YesM